MTRTDKVTLAVFSGCWLTICLAVLAIGLLSGPGPGPHSVREVCAMVMIALSFPSGWLGIRVLEVLFGSIGTPQTAKESFLWLWGATTLFGYVQWVILAPVVVKAVFRLFSDRQAVKLNLR